MNETKTVTIRLNETDINHMNLVKEFLEEKYKDLPPRYREITTTDIFKYVLSLWVRNYNNQNDMIL